MVIHDAGDDTLAPADADRIFHALADATRRDIVARVVQREQSVSQLATSYAMSFAAVHKHVTVLERAALVVKVRRGREQIVHGNPESLRAAAVLLEHYQELWQRRARSITEILSEDPPIEQRRTT